jgi:hypothetical protein
MRRAKLYLLNVLVGIDQLLNALLGGDCDETLSSRAGKHYPRLAKIINFIFFWQDDHCKYYIEEDEGKDTVIK